MENLNEDEENAIPRKKVTLFGRDIAEITCFRNSFICGICTGVAGGLITFMFTSKAIVSTHTAFASLWLGVFVYWFPCRYKYESRMLMAEEWKKAQKLSAKEKREKEKMETSEKSNEENK